MVNRKALPVLGLVATVALLGLLVSSERTVAASTMDDNFNDNFLNPALWSPYVIGDVGGTVSETNRRLEVTLNPGASNVGVVSLCSAAGDFDVQVDFSLLNWPPGNRQAVTFGAADLGGGVFGIFSVGRHNIGESYFMQFPNETGAGVPTSDLSGTLRLVRLGSTLSGYYHDGTDFVFLDSATAPTNATRFVLNGGNFLPDVGSASIAFDNFRVRQGAVNCPPAPPESDGDGIEAPGFAPSGLAYDGTSLYVSDLSGFRRIYKMDPQTGAVLGSFLAPGPTGLDGRGNPNGLSYDGAGHLFVSDIGDFGAGIVYEIDTAGTTIFNSFSLPFRGGGIAFDGTNLYIADHDSGAVRVTDRSGLLIRTFDSQLRPAGLAFDPALGHLWVISESDMKVSEITTEGNLIRSCDGPRDPGIQGLGGVTVVGSKLYLAEVSDPDPFNPPEVPGTIHVVDPNALTCSMIDTDGDGIPDTEDACPGTPPGVRVRRNGCPRDATVDIAITKHRVHESSVVNTERAVFDIDVENIGDGNAHGGSLKETLPEGFKFVSSTLIGEGSCSSVDVRTVSCELGTLEPGETAFLAVVAETPCVDERTRYRDAAQVGADRDDNARNNESSARVTVLPDRPGNAPCEQRLAEKFAPVLFIDPQDPYDPKEVGIVLNETSKLKEDRRRRPDRPVDCDPETDGTQSAPTVSCLYEHRKKKYYIDLPGNTDANEAREAYGQLNQPPNSYDTVVYAHVTDEESGGKTYVGLQYWFFYYFNDWLGILPFGKHEGDWEMIQLLFEANGPAEILNEGKTPFAVGFSQHFGGTASTWGDVRTQDGTHPKVYVAEGSHANFSRPGSHPVCFRTLACVTDEAPGEGEARTLTFEPDDIRLMPDTPPKRLRDTQYAWLSFKGRWGQPDAGIRGPMWIEANGKLIRRTAWSLPLTWTTCLAGPDEPC